LPQLIPGVVSHGCQPVDYRRDPAPCDARFPSATMTGNAADLLRANSNKSQFSRKNLTNQILQNS